jgi:hypothetical protein
MDKLTNAEKLMYDIMGAIADGNVPVVYKGAMITKLILRENHFDDFVRETQDIDASWTGMSQPSMEQLATMLNSALSRFGLNAAVKRKYGKTISAGFKIIDAAGDVKLSMDIDMRAAVDSRMYQFGNVTFRGVTPNSVISDKISVVSSDKVCRRAKDLIDLYALAHCVTIQKQELYKLWMKEKRTIGTFEAFAKRRDDLEHAYEKLRRIEAKPDFRELYEYLTVFLAPFIESDLKSNVWDNRNNAWVLDESPNLTHGKKKSLLDTLEEAKRISANQNPQLNVKKKREHGIDD